MKEVSVKSDALIPCTHLSQLTHYRTQTCTLTCTHSSHAHISTYWHTPHPHMFTHIHTFIPCISAYWHTTASTHVHSQVHIHPVVFLLYINDIYRSSNRMGCWRYDSFCIPTVTITMFMPLWIDNWLKAKRLSFNVRKTLYMIIFNQKSFTVV